MVDQLPSTSRAPSLENALSTLVESKMVTVEQQKALTVAASNQQLMKHVSTPIGQRYFDRIDTQLAVRNPSPTSKARELLSEFGSAWDGVMKDFHHFRKLFFEARLKRAHLAKKKSEAEKANLPEYDIAILQAEIELEEANLAAIEAEVASGEAKMKAELQKAVGASTRYAALCKAEGKAEFTEADFKAEEVDYFLKSAWWYAAQVFTTYDSRDQWARPQDAPKSRAEAAEQLRKAKEHRQLRIKHEVKLFFSNLGISEQTVDQELRGLLKMREAYDFSTRNNGEYQPPATAFAEHFDSWVARTAAKYRGAAGSAIEQHGTHFLQRISKLLNPNVDDAGKPGDVGEMRRSTMTDE